MAKLVYSALTSLDGYVADPVGNFDWAEPSEELHSFVNELERSVGTYLYGRRMYETMVFWETAHTLRDEPQVMRDYALIWQAAEKIVYSTTLESVSSKKTRIEKTFEPNAVQEMKRTADTDISIGGPGLASAALKAGLVDECHLFVNPVVIGGGNPAFQVETQLDLELIDQRPFPGGVMHLHYQVTAPSLR